MSVRKLVAGLAILLVIIAAALYGINFYAQGEARAQVEATFAHLPPDMQGRHGAVSYSLLRDRLVLADVAFDGSNPWFRSVRAARLEVTGVNHGFFAALLSRGWGSGADAWSAGTLAASNIEYELGDGIHQSIERLVVNDPRLDLTGDVPIEQRSLAQWIVALSWSSGEATNFRAAADALPDGASVAITAAERSFSELKAGHLAGTVDRNLVWDGTIPQLGGKAHMEVGEAHVSDLDIVACDKVFDPANYQGDQRDPTFYPLSGAVALSKLTVTFEGRSTVSLSLDALSVAGIKMRQLPFAPNALPAQPTPEQTLDLAQSVSLGAIEIDKLAVTSAQLADTALSLDRFALKLDDKNHAEIANLSLKSPEANFAIGSMQLDGLAVRLPDKLLPLIRIAAPGDAPPPSSRPGVFVEHYQLSDVAFQNKAVGEISLKDLTLDMTGSLDKPTGATLEMQRLGVDLGAIGRNPGAAMVGALGYGQVFFEAHGKTGYDVDAKTMDSHFSFGAPEMGMLGLAYRLSNYGLDWDPTDRDAMMRQVMNIAIERLELRYDDASLANHVIDLMASQANEPPAAMRQSFVTALEQQKSVHASEPLVVNALDTVIDFVVKPTAIRVTAKPSHPIALGELAGIGTAQPNDVMTLLGIVVDRPLEAR